MADGLADLTDKEKEALRLLLAGHDAKSSAAELDISVHTLNDRLRNARRKLGVTSSREAARVLGDAEEATPQTPAHKPLGVGETPDRNDDGGIAEANERNGSASAWRKNGVLIMACTSTILAAAAIAISFNAGSDAESGVSPTGSDDGSFAASPPLQSSEAEAAALEWLALVDAGDAEGSRGMAAEALRQQIGPQFWEFGVALRRNNFGVVVNRRLVSVERTGRHNGAAGDYEILTFETDFAKERGVIETIYMLEVDGEWRAAEFVGEQDNDCS